MKLLTAPRIIAAILFLIALKAAALVFIPFTAAIFLAMLADPLVGWLQARGLSRSRASLIALFTFVFGIGLMGGGGYGLSRPTLDQIPSYEEKIRREMQTALDWRARAPWEPTLLDNVQKVQVVDGGGAWYGILYRTAGSAMEFISMLLFIPLFLFYFLLDKSNLLESLYTLTGRTLYPPKIATELPRMVRTFFVAHLAAGLLLSACHFAIFASLGLHNSLGLGIITGFLNLIPLLGSLLAVVFPVAQGLMQWTDTPPFLFLVGGVTALHLVTANVILPQFIGRSIDVNPAGLLLGLLFWGWMWGGLGFLLAIPLTATLKILLASNPETRALANLLAARPRHIQGAVPRAPRVIPRPPESVL